MKLEFDRFWRIISKKLSLFSMRPRHTLKKCMHHVSLLCIFKASCQGLQLYFRYKIHSIQKWINCLILFFKDPNKNLNILRYSRKVKFFHNFHIVWKSLKMSHLNFKILAFSTNFCTFKSDLSGNTNWPKVEVFKDSPKLTIFGIFCILLFTQNVNIARFARNVEWNSFLDFQTQWIFLGHFRESNTMFSSDCVCKSTLRLKRMTTTTASNEFRFPLH